MQKVEQVIGKHEFKSVFADLPAAPHSFTFVVWRPDVDLPRAYQGHRYNIDNQIYV